MGHDLNAALLFVRVVEAGSLRAASRLTGVPKSTLSRKLAELEERLGARLLQRTTRRIGLTELGRSYHAQASVAVAQLLEAERSISQAQSEPSGTLRLTASTSVGTLLLPELLLAFLKAHPQVRLHVELTDRVVDLVQEGFDLAIRAGPLADSSLVAQRLADLDMHVHASPAYLAAHGRPRTLDDLAKHELLVFSSVGDSWRFVNGRRAVTIPVSGRLVVNSLSLLRDAAIAGLGLARLPSVIAEPAVHDGRLVRLLEDYAPRPAPLHAVYPSARYVAPAVRALLGLLRERLSRRG